MRRTTISTVSPLEYVAESLGLRGNQVDDNDTVWLFYFSGTVAFSTGIFLTAVRLLEPLFRLLVVKEIYQYFGEVYGDD